MIAGQCFMVEGEATWVKGFLPEEHAEGLQGHFEGRRFSPCGGGTSLSTQLTVDGFPGESYHQGRMDRRGRRSQA
jgi:hypothetical protein